MKRLDQLLNFLEQSPNDAFILFAIAKEHENEGNLDKALDYYLQLKTANADYVGLYYHLGKLYEQTGKVEEALATYQNGMEVANKAKDRHAYGELNEAFMSLED